MRVLDVILKENQNPVRDSSLNAGQWTNVYINSQRFRFVAMDTQAEREAIINRFLRDIGAASSPQILITKLRRHGIDIPPGLTSYQAIDTSLQTLANTDPNLGPAVSDTAPDGRSQELQDLRQQLVSAIPSAPSSFDTDEAAVEYIRSLINWIRETRGEEFVDVIHGRSNGARQAVRSMVDRIASLRSSLPVSKSDIDSSMYQWLIIADRVVQAAGNS